MDSLWLLWLGSYYLLNSMGLIWLNGIYCLNKDYLKCVPPEYHPTPSSNLPKAERPNSGSITQNKLIKIRCFQTFQFKPPKKLNPPVSAVTSSFFGWFLLAGLEPPDSRSITQFQKKQPIPEVPTNWKIGWYSTGRYFCGI